MKAFAHSLRRPLLMLLLPVMLFSTAAAAESQGIGVGAELGIWKPSELDRFPSRPLKNVDGAAPYVGGDLLLPFFRSHVLRVSVMQWRQNELEEVNLSSVILRQLAFNLKYLLLPQYFISPYACYGASAFWSRELRRNEAESKPPLDRAGWGFDVGAGIDLVVNRRWAVGAEYQYLYARFAKRVGLTDDYSGPRVSARLFFFF